MSKPYGMTPTLRVVRPSQAEDAIWDAVEEAIDSGMTPKQFRREAAEAWSQLLRDAAKAADKSLSA